jgi:hypothetical protein
LKVVNRDRKATLITSAKRSKAEGTVSPVFKKKVIRSQKNKKSETRDASQVQASSKVFALFGFRERGTIFWSQFDSVIPSGIEPETTPNRSIGCTVHAGWRWERRIAAPDKHLRLAIASLKRLACGQRVM